MKDHKLALFFAFLVGIIIAFPQIYFTHDHSEEYQGICVTCTDNEFFYLQRVREVLDGHLSLANPVFKEGKSGPFLQPPLGEILIAYLGKIFFLDLNNTILAARFLFSFLTCLAAYGFMFFFSRQKLIALTSSVAVFLGYNLISRQGLFILLKGGAISGNGFLNLFRPVQPQMNFLFFFAFLLFFWLFFDASTRLSVKRRWIWGGISIVILGLSFYVYPYAWNFLYTFCGVLILIFLIQKNWQKAKGIILILLGGIFIAIPYFLNFFQAVLHPDFWEASSRFGAIDSRQPVLGLLVPTLFIIFLLFFRKEWKERYIFSFALLLTPFIVLNQQVITGVAPSTAHYHWYIHIPLTVLFFVLILLEAIERKLFKKAIAFFIIGLSIYNGVFIQVLSYRECQDKILAQQKYAPIVEWLNTNTKKEEVVLASSGLASFIPIYTSLNLFSASSAYGYLSVSRERLLNSLFLSYRLEGLKAEDAKWLFLQKEERIKISAAIFNEYYKEKYKDHAAIPDEILLAFAEKYQDFLLIPLDEFLKMHYVKYAVWDIKENPQWQLEQYKFLKKVKEINDFRIYQIL